MSGYETTLTHPKSDPDDPLSPNSSTVHPNAQNLLPILDIDHSHRPIQMTDRYYIDSRGLG